MVGLGHIEIFGSGEGEEMFGQVDAVFTEQGNEVAKSFKKMVGKSNERLVELKQILNVMKSVCKYTVVLSNIQERFKEKMKDFGSFLETNRKLPEVFPKLKDLLAVVYDIVEKAIDVYSLKLEKIKLETLNPSSWKEIQTDLDSLQVYLSSLELPSANTEPLVQPFRPFVDFLARFKSEKKTVSAIEYGLHLSKRMSEILNSTLAKKYLQSLNQKLVKTSIDLSENLAFCLTSKINEKVNSIPNRDKGEIQRQEAIISYLKTDGTNPSTIDLEILSSLEMATRTNFISKYLKFLSDVTTKATKKSKEFEELFNQAKDQFSLHYTSVGSTDDSDRLK